VVREAVAAGIILRIGKEDGETNLADLLMKNRGGEEDTILYAYYVLTMNPQRV
jgi:hypothetical protein